MGCINVKRQSFQQIDKLSFNTATDSLREATLKEEKEKEKQESIEEHELEPEPSDKEKRIFTVTEQDTQKQEGNTEPVSPVLQIKNMMETTNRPFKFIKKLKTVHSNCDSKTNSLKNEDESTNVFDWKERSVLQIKFQGFVQSGTKTLYRVEGYYLNN